MKAGWHWWWAEDITGYNMGREKSECMWRVL